MRLLKLGDINQALISLGYNPTFQDDTVLVPLGAGTNKFTAVLTIADDPTSDQQQLTITCQVARLGDFPEENQAAFFASALDANTELIPYAFATITATDNPHLTEPNQWPVVLINSVPLGDFSVTELESAMNKLNRALQLSADTIRIGVNGLSA